MAKEELLSAIEGKNQTAFLDLLKQHGNKRSPVDLSEVLIEVNRIQQNKIWTVLHSWANEQLMKLLDDPNSNDQQDTVNGESAPGHDAEVQMRDVEDQQGDIQDGGEAESATGNAGGEKENTQCQQVEPYNELLMLGILEFAAVYLGTIRGPEAFIPEKLLELAVLLHGMVSVLEGKVHEAVLSLCEMWWVHELEEREHLIGNVLPILVQSALAKSGRKKDVLCVYNIRGALQVLEFDEPFITLLVDCAASPHFIGCDEGVKWVSELFSWQALVQRLHRSIKSVLPDCTRLQSSKYAEVYFRAWKKSTGDVQQMIEEDCIQDLMYAAVHVDPISGRLSGNLHHLLHHIHRHKRHHLVEKMILSLYNPFLWRSLNAANGYVRMNATGLLCDVFPLSDSTCTLEERQELMEKQYQTIITLLTDPCHLVRITAIKGTCNILNNYWLMIPSQIIKTIFHKLLSELLCDASSAEVRTQVVKGLTLLLDNNDAVPFLKEILPRISDAFDDISSSVRMAFVNLLLKVKALKIVRYWTIVPVNHLLHRLEDDVPAVCKLLTQLLLSSFHPTQRQDQELLQRCLALLEENRGAARRFYQYASRTLDLPSTVHFMLLIWHCLRSFIVSQQSQNATALSEGLEDCGNTSATNQPASSRESTLKSSSSSPNSLESSRVPSSRTENKENRDSGDNDDEDPLNNPTVIGGLLDTVVILWSTNAHRLAQPQNLKYLEALRIRISKSMPLFFKFFKENKDVSQTLLYLSSFLPKSLVPTLVGHCLSRLRSLQQDEDHGDSYVTYINALCNWNRVDDVLELATDWLTESFNTANISQYAKERRLSGRGVRFHESHSAQPLLALRLIRHILQHPLNKLAALSKNRPLVVELVETLKTSKDLIDQRLNHGEELSNLCSDRLLSESWSQYLSLVAVLHKPAKETPVEPETEEDDAGETDEVFNSCDHLEDCLEWASRVLVPGLSDEEVGEKRKSRAGEEAVRISVDALRHLITVSNNIVIIGAADSDFVFRLCGFSDVLLKSEMCENFWEMSLLIALEGHQYLQAYGVENEALPDGTVTPVDLVNSCITSLSENLKEDKAIPKEADNIEKTLGLVLTNFGQNSRTTQTEILQHMSATIVDHLCMNVDKMHGVDRDIKTLNELGTCLSVLIGGCQSRVKLSSGLMETLASFVTDSVMDTTAILAIAHLLQVLSQDSGKISRYNLKQAVVAVDNVSARMLLPVRLNDSTDSNDVAANIYEDYAKVTKEIVDDLKSSLGIV